MFYWKQLTKFSLLSLAEVQLLNADKVYKRSFRSAVGKLAVWFITLPLTSRISLSVRDDLLDYVSRDAGF